MIAVVKEAPAAKRVVTLDNVAIRFPLEEGGTVEVVKGVSFYIDQSETLALVGESGSGKSLTSRTIMRLLPSQAMLGSDSRITFFDQDITRASERAMQKLRGNRIAMIFQEPMTSLNPVYTIGSQITEVLMYHRRMSRKEAYEKALDLLREVQIPQPEARLKQYPHQLSGGQRQRVMIAIAIANDPELLIADEPTTALDVTVQAEILKLLRRLQERHHMALLLITHDLTIVEKFSDRVCVMQQGRIVETGPTAAVFKDPQHPYTRHLLASEPKGRPDPLRSDAEPILEGRKIEVRFELSSGGLFRRKKHELIAVDKLDLTLRHGQTIGVVGESGSGKTTLGQSLVRLIECQGEILWKGRRIDGLDRKGMRPYRPKIQIVFQDPFSALNSRMSIKQIVEERLVINGLGGGRKERDRLVRKTLEEVGLDPNSLNRFPHEFSGGQRQRIAIARAIILQPEFILLDEPTSALDLSVQSQIIELLRELRRTHDLSYLFISHDLKVVRALCHEIIVMRHGKVVETGLTEEIMERPKTEYTQALIRAAFEVET